MQGAPTTARYFDNRYKLTSTFVTWSQRAYSGGKDLFCSLFFKDKNERDDESDINGKKRTDYARRQQPRIKRKGNYNNGNEYMERNFISTISSGFSTLFSANMDSKRLQISDKKKSEVVTPLLSFSLLRFAPGFWVRNIESNMSKS